MGSKTLLMPSLALLPQNFIHILVILIFLFVLSIFYKKYKSQVIEDDENRLQENNTSGTLLQHSEATRPENENHVRVQDLVYDSTTDNERVREFQRNQSSNNLVNRPALKRSFSIWDTTGLQNLTDYIKKSSSLPIPSNLIPGSTDQRTGRKLKKRERALILAKRIMRLESSSSGQLDKNRISLFSKYMNGPVASKEYKNKKIPNEILEPDNDEYTDYLSDGLSSSSISKELIYIQKNIKVFGYLDNSILLSLVKNMEIIELSENQTLFKPGDFDNSIYIIREGMIDVSIEGQVIDRKFAGNSIQSLLSVLDILLSEDFKEKFGIN